MKRFIAKVLVAVMLLGAVLVGMHVFTVLSMQKIVDEVYTLKPEQDVLVLGASELGCSIVQSERYHNKSIWVSDTTIPSVLMRLRELERRGQLGGVKTLIVPFNFTVLLLQTDFTTKWAWYQELPISWRYVDDMPCGKFELVSFIASNLRWPLAAHVFEAMPSRMPLSARPEKWRENFIKSQCRQSDGNPLESLPTGWEERLLGAYRSIFEITQRHGIRPVVLRPPLLPQYLACQPKSLTESERQWVVRLKELGFEYCEVTNRFDESVFCDTRHLIPEGAELFTEELYRKLKLQHSRP